MHIDFGSPGDAWRWDGQQWMKVDRPHRLAGRRRALAIQVLLGAWVAAVLLELFIFNAWFELDLTKSDGSDLPLRWGIVSAFIAVAIAAMTIAWLASIASAAIRAVATSQKVGLLFGLWAGLLWLYVVSDITLAEVVRGEPIAGPETRWPVLLSAGLGIAAAVAGVALIRSVMRHAATMARGVR